MEIVKAAVALAATQEETTSSARVEEFFEIFNERASRPAWLKTYRQGAEGEKPWWRITVFRSHTPEVEAMIRAQLASAGWGLKEVVRRASTPDDQRISYLVGTLEDYPVVG